MTEILANGQSMPPTLPGFDLDELIARIEATLKTKPEIQPNAVYDRNEAIAVTGFSLSTLIRAEEKGKLRGRYEGRRRFFFGSDLLRWLKSQSASCATCGDLDSVEFHETESGEFLCDNCFRHRPKPNPPKNRR